MVNHLLFFQQWSYRILLILVLALVAFNVWAWRKPTLDVHAWVSQLERQPSSSSAQYLFSPNIKPFQTYEKVLNERNPFEAYKEASVENQDTVDSSRMLKQLPSHLHVVGVLQENNQYELIVEDRQKNETIFLVQGEKSDQLLLHNINQETIRLQYQNSMYEVPLNP